MTDLSPSQRLYALRDLNEREEIAQARQASDLLAFVVLGLVIGALSIWAAILTGAM